MAKTKSLKSLAHMKNSSQGAVHHMVILPARNDKGKMGFITEKHRAPSEQQQAAAQGGYLPDSIQEQPDTAHEDANDMLAHVGSSLGIPAANAGDAGDEQGADAE